MKQLFVTFSFLCTFHVLAQESITPLNFSCTNGQQTTQWLSVVPGNIMVKLSIELDEPRTLRCILDGNFHHNEYVEESGERIVNFNGVSPGNPDHVVTFSLWDGNIETHPGIAVDFIFPWIYEPPLSVTMDSLVGDTLVRWHITRGPFFHMPNSPSGIGGCIEHKMFILEKLIQGGEVIFTADTVEVMESVDTVVYEFEAIYHGPLDSVCSETTVIRIDTGTDEPDDFPPTELPMSSLQEACVLAGILSTGEVERNTSNIQVFPNPFTESFNVQGASGTYTVHTGTGLQMQNGHLTGTTNINGSAWEKGLYILTITNPSGERTVKKLVCE